MDTLTSIKVFRQVVDSGSFVRAAERLDMSTATVSKYVMHAEKRLGVRLLNRNSRFLSLTEPGRLYFERCQNILDELRATELELGSLGRTPRGTLRVSAPSLVSGQWLANLLAEYRRRYPDVLVDLSFEEGIVNLVDEGYDLALRIATSLDSLPADLIARPLRPTRFCFAASHGYVKRRGAPKSLDELAQHDFVAADDMPKCLLRSAAAQKTEVPLRVVLRYRSAEGVANAVAAGIGIALVPAVLFDEPTFRDVLTPILPNYPLQQATLYAVYASHKFVPPKLRTFVDFVIEYLSQDPKPKAPLFQALQASPSALTPRAKVLCRLPEARLAP
jgi:DNA-binding transcriptional LysR family regulator